MGWPTTAQMVSWTIYYAAVSWYEFETRVYYYTYLYSERLNVVGPVGSPSEVRQVKLDLVPAVVQPHGHGADERLHSGCWLVVGRSKTSTNVFIIQHLKREREREREREVSWTFRWSIYSVVVKLYTWTSNVKYFFKFLMIITRNGNFIPRVFFGSAGQVMNVVLHGRRWEGERERWPHVRTDFLHCPPYLTLVPTISNTSDWMSLSVILLIWPFLTCIHEQCMHGGHY